MDNIKNNYNIISVANRGIDYVLDFSREMTKKSIYNILLITGLLSTPSTSFANSNVLEMTKEQQENCNKKMDVLKDSLSELADKIKEILEIDDFKKTEGEKLDFIIGKKNKIILKDNEAIHFATFYTALIKDTRFLKQKFTPKDVDLCISYFINSLRKENKKNISKDLTVSELAAKINKLLKEGKFNIELRVKK